MTGQFSPSTLPTIGAAFQNHIMNTSKGAVTLQIWDTAGQERYRALTPMYYRNAQVIVLVFDLTSSQTFASLDDWMADLEGKANDDVQMFVVGNKADLTADRLIEANAGRGFADKIGAVDFVETSAKSGQGVNELFSKVADTAQARSQAIVDSLPSVAANEESCKC
jgi:small GTP-binding protein